MLRHLDIAARGHSQGQPLKKPHARSYVNRNWATTGKPSLYGLRVYPKDVAQVALAGAEDIHGLAQQFRRDMIGHCHNLERCAPRCKS